MLLVLVLWFDSICKVRGMSCVTTLPQNKAWPLSVKVSLLKQEDQVNLQAGEGLAREA